MPSPMGRDRSMAYILSPLVIRIQYRMRSRPRVAAWDEEEHVQEYKNILARADVSTKTVNNIKKVNYEFFNSCNYKL